MALVPNLANLDAITETWTDAVTNGLNTGTFSGTYTPSLTGMAVGTGGSAANTATYSFVGGVLVASGNIVFGTSGATLPGASAETISMPSGFTFTAPASTYVGTVLLSSGGVQSIGALRIESTGATNTIRPLAFNAAGTYLTAVDLTATIPGTWAAGDTIRWQIVALGTMA